VPGDKLQPALVFCNIDRLDGQMHNSAVLKGHAAGVLKDLPRHTCRKTLRPRQVRGSDRHVQQTGSNLLPSAHPVR